MFSFTGCGKTFGGNSGVITSPNHPDNHPSSMDCLYIVRVANGSIITLSFSHFDLEVSEGKTFGTVITFFLLDFLCT